MKKFKKVLLGIGISVLSLVLIAGIAFMIIRVPALTIDFSQQSDLTGRAAGFLYGLAEEDIPTSEIAESVGINTLATKPAGGLQHPIGDVNQVAETFTTAGGEYLMIYTQDMNDTWYYQFDSLELYNEKVKTTVTEMENSEYKDKLVYCIYNEMDNGEWFGNHWRRLTDITFSNDSIVVSVKEIGQMKNYLTITPNDMTIYNGATIEDDGNTSSGKRIGWISSENGGCATFNVSVEDAGYYNFIIEYANSEEGGFHAYNVDLIER